MELRLVAVMAGLCLGACGQVSTEPKGTPLVEVGYFQEDYFNPWTDSMVVRRVEFNREAMYQVPTMDTLIIVPAVEFRRKHPEAVNGASLWYRDGDCYYTRQTWEAGFGCIPVQ